MLRIRAYYTLAFLLETELFTALRTKGLRGVRRDSRLLSPEHFVLVHLPFTLWIGGVFETKIPELRRRCFEAPQCAVHLRRRSAWLWPLEPQPEDGEFAFFDGADIQWREFRGSLSLLLPAAALLAGLVRVVLALSARGGRHSPGAAVLVRLVVGLGFVAFLHGAGVIFLLVLLLAFFMLGRGAAGTPFAVPCAWLLAILAIAAKEPKWPIKPWLKFRHVLGPDWAWLDAYGGEYEWESSVNLLVLKLLSFALDAHASAKALRGEAQPSSGSASTWAEHRQRYSLTQCVSHGFYAPLFIAGPTIAFDDFADQVAAPRTLPGAALAWYAAQLVVAMLFLEVASCTVPLFALARSGVLGSLPPSLGAPAVLGTLNIMWLKFLVIWRIARCWALADGIDPPENMRRCLNNHYSVASFWKSWHVSYNKWLVRYIYIPVGGKTRRVLATTVTFMFVAYWHDVEAKLLAWGGLNALFIALEGVATPAAQRAVQATGLPTKHPYAYRWLCAAGGAVLIVLLMAGNMIGYSFGLSGAEALLETAASPQARGEILGVAGFVFATLTFGTMNMFEVRELDGTFAAQASKAKTSPASGASDDDVAGKKQ